MNDNPPPSPELISALRDQAFEEIGRVSDLAASYSRSLGEAALPGRSDNGGGSPKAIALVLPEHDQGVQRVLEGRLAELKALYAREHVRLSDEARREYFRGPRRG